MTLVTFSVANAQEVRVIDNKGTIQQIRNNQVTVSTTAPTNPLEGDVWYDTNTTPLIVKIWDEPSGQWEEVPGINNFWSLTGNSGTNPTTNFLGTIDAQDLVFRTSNVERMRLRSDAGQLLVNQAPVFNNHPLVIRANGVDVLAFQNAAGTPQWHWNLLAGGLNFVESNVADYRLFLENGGNVGINTNDPTEFLDVNGGARVRTLPTVTTDLDIVVATGTGVLQKKPFLAAETDNQLELGANGGAYLPSSTGGLITTSQTIRSTNRSRILIQSVTNINANTTNPITPASFQLNEIGATINGNNITNLEGNIRFIVYPNLISSGSQRTNFNCQFIVNATLTETQFTGLYARNQSDHRDTGGAIIFEYENAVLSDEFSFSLFRETTITDPVALINTSKIFIEQFSEVSVITSASAPVDLSIVQGPQGPQGVAGPQGIPGPTISGPLDVYHAAGNINQTGSINYIQGANIIRNSVGSYTVTLTNPHPNTTTYPILITLERNAGTDDYGATYTIISNTIFNIEIREQDDGAGGGVLRDSSFSFYVPF
ncbi:MAG: hypothetical protein EVB11_07190 [Winogradskyella sp.]|nr:MAG: hypothetical protein EVB11_07190 [Winogradskyella sp.]